MSYTKKTLVIHIRDCRKWPHQRVVMIGRGGGSDGLGEWGNPFVMGIHGSRDVVVAKYRQWLWRKMAAVSFRLKVAALQGKVLACFCKPKRCHGDILAQAAEWAAGQRDHG